MKLMSMLKTAPAAREPSTIQGLMARAEQDEQPYVFEDGGREDPHVIPIPISLDQRFATLREMNNHMVTLQAEHDRIAGDMTKLAGEIRKHQVDLSKRMLEVGIPAPMASEETE